MLVAIFLSALGCLGLHLLIWRGRRTEYGVAFKMARGIAAVVLTLLGLAGLWGALPHWDVGFLYEHATDDWMVYGVAIAYGHLVADMLSMAYGRALLGERARPDLIAHHALGLVAYGVSLWLGIGHALVLISLASEIMPCCSGLEAWGRHLDRPDWMASAARWRLRVLVFWRLPLWGVVLTLLIRAILLETLPSGLPGLAAFVLACLAVLVALDVYWVRKCVASAQRRDVGAAAA